MFKVLKSHSKAIGTSLQGYVHCEYKTLVELFGQPLPATPDGKVQAKWIIKFQDGTICTIYDWKRYGVPLERITEWNVGGNKQAVVEYLRPLFPFSSTFENR